MSVPGDEVRRPAAADSWDTRDYGVTVRCPIEPTAPCWWPDAEHEALSRAEAREQRVALIMLHATQAERHREAIDRIGREHAMEGGVWSLLVWVVTGRLA